MNTQTGEWVVNGVEHEPLSCKGAMILSVLLKNSGRIVTPAVFRDEVWGGHEREPENLRVHLAHLRRRLRAAAAPVEIQAFKGRGYRLRERE